MRAGISLTVIPSSPRRVDVPCGPSPEPLLARALVPPQLEGHTLARPFVHQRQLLPIFPRIFRATRNMLHRPWPTKNPSARDLTFYAYMNPTTLSHPSSLLDLLLGSIPSLSPAFGKISVSTLYGLALKYSGTFITSSPPSSQREGESAEHGLRPPLFQAARRSWASSASAIRGTPASPWC